MKKYSILFILSILIGNNERTYNVDLENSSLMWTAEKLTGSHWGYINLDKGAITVQKNKILSGEFIVDMSTISVMDIKDSPWGQKLENHLKNSDFFDIEKFSDASFIIKNISTINNQETIKGDLTIKGITEAIEFPAEIKFSKSGVIAKGRISVDRTKYDIKYRSQKYYPDIGDKLIYDIFYIDFELKAK